MLTILAQRLMKYSANAALKMASRADLSKVKELDQYYFGYGANLTVKRFHDKGMSAELVGSAKLKDFELTFSLPCEYKEKGYADIQPKEGSEVWGALFKINSYSLKLLDIMEWVPFSFYKKINVSIECDGKFFDNVIAYQAVFPKFNLNPSKQYLDFIIKRSEENGVPQGYIQKLKKVESRESFELDSGFCLSSPGKRRIFEDKLKSAYLAHDKLREKVAELLP